MPIDWFTVSAQAVNFLVLVWLLKRFLYGPILSAIDAREKGIAATLSDAELKKIEAQKEHDDFQHKSEAFEQQRVALLSKATEDAKAEGERLMAAARTDIDSVRSEWQNALRSEQKTFSEEVVRRTRQSVFDIARKTLAELATTSLEECMSDVFIARLRTLPKSDHDQFAASFSTDSSPLVVRSAFDLPPTQQAAMKAAIQETFAFQTPIHFETNPNLVSGIELTSNGQKISWSIADSLTTLEKNVGELLEEKAKPEPAVLAVST